MKKSLAYKAAQFSVLADKGLCGHNKLEILRVLMEAEDLAAYCEKQEEREVKTNAEAL